MKNIVENQGIKTDKPLPMMRSEVDDDNEANLEFVKAEICKLRRPGEILSAFCPASIESRTLRFSHATLLGICLMVMSIRSTRRFTLGATATTRRRTSGAAMAFANQKLAI